MSDQRLDQGRARSVETTGLPAEQPQSLTAAATYQHQDGAPVNGDSNTSARAPMDTSDSLATRPSKDAGGIQSVHRAMHLLSLFATKSHEGSRRTRWSVSDLARASGLHKSVVARLMATMARHGFVFQDPASKTYSIGPEAFAVGSSYEPYTVLNQVARPVMERLTAACGHASYLGVPAPDHYVFLIACESTRSIRVAIAVGERRQYHAGAIGKAMIASWDDERIRETVGPDPLPQLTAHTIDSIARLLTEIEEVRRSGVAFNRQESILGAGSIAVGIHDAAGDAIAGLGIVYPTHIVSVGEIATLAVTVAEAGQEIAEQLRVGPVPSGLG